MPPCSSFFLACFVLSGVGGWESRLVCCMMAVVCVRVVLCVSRLECTRVRQAVEGVEREEFVEWEGCGEGGACVTKNKNVS
jgi:hypothetical protein